MKFKPTSLLGVLSLACAMGALTMTPTRALAQTASATAPHKHTGTPDAFRPRFRHLLYVSLPGSLERPGWLNGVGVVVLDADDGYRFVKRIPTWQYAGSMSPEQCPELLRAP